MKLKTLCAALAMTLSAGFANAQDYVLNTASTGGTYHPVGVAISTLTKVKLLPVEGFSLTAVNSAGSGANIQAMAAGTADFSILQGIFGSYAATGTGPITEPQKNLRSIAMLWPNVEHFVLANEYVDTGTVSDLIKVKGQRVGMGSKNSGTLGSNTALLAGLGLDVEKDFQLLYAGYTPTVEALANNQIVAAGIPSGPPAGAITQLMAGNADSFTVLDITDEELAKMDAGRDLWTRYVIAADVYPGQTKPINTAGQPNFLAVNASVDEDHVYKLTKAIFENLPFLQAIHPATRDMSLETALSGLPLPLHPGAVRYFQEAGVTIPERLMPPAN